MPSGDGSEHRAAQKWAGGRSDPPVNGRCGPLRPTRAERRGVPWHRDPPLRPSVRVAASAPVAGDARAFR